MKRLFDIVFSVILLLTLLPLFLILSTSILAIMGRPVLFKQSRPGRNGVAFEMYKFRTMLNAINDKGEPLPDAERLTAFGRFLRSSSLDELPELWNVFKGDMSFVGPRPLLLEYLPLYSAEQYRRHEVRPGITGWAQINGRNAICWEKKFECDIWYVDNCSFLLDMRIIWITLVKVFKREGISAPGDATMPKFAGTAEDTPAFRKE
jgi:lipopolysaccharide/colanic/teichoic acid biosynthesis glycosyltransferase